MDWMGTGAAAGGKTVTDCMGEEYVGMEEAGIM